LRHAPRIIIIGPWHLSIIGWVVILRMSGSGHRGSLTEWRRHGKLRRKPRIDVRLNEIIRRLLRIC